MNKISTLSLITLMLDEILFKYSEVVIGIRDFRASFSSHLWWEPFNFNLSQTDICKIFVFAKANRTKLKDTKHKLQFYCHIQKIKIIFGLNVMLM